jgi:predicted DsbA family dithiol-disulfide isomerase
MPAGAVTPNITWHAFLLDANFDGLHPAGADIDAYVAAKFGSTAAPLRARLAASGAEAGAAFADWRWRAATFDGHRLGALARREGKSDASAGVLFRRAYEDGENLSETATLLAAAEELCLPGAAEWLASGAGAEEVEADDRRAKEQLHVSGVPAFFISAGGGDARPVFLSGAQPEEVFVAAFEEALREAAA